MAGKVKIMVYFKLVHDAPIPALQFSTDEEEIGLIIPFNECTFQIIKKDEVGNEVDFGRIKRATRDIFTSYSPHKVKIKMAKLSFYQAVNAYLSIHLGREHYAQFNTITSAGPVELFIERSIEWMDKQQE